MKKKLLLTSFITLLAVGTQAQSKVGIHGNYLLSNATFTSGGEALPNKKSYPGWKFGLLFHTPIGKGFVFLPELNVVDKGVKGSETSTTTDFTGTTYNTNENVSLNTTFLEIPANFAYSQSTSSGTFLIGLGPVFGVGLSGKLKATGTQTTIVNSTVVGSQSLNQEIKLKLDGDANANDNYGHLKRFEAGFDFFVSYMLNNGLFFRAMYYQAASNLALGGDGTYRTNYLGIGLGYFFNSAKKGTGK